MRPYTRAPNPTGKNPEWVVPQAVAALLNGKGNNIGDVTLTANSATTTLLNPLITPSSHISFSPLTLNAAAAIAGLYVSARADGTATLTHANNAQTDRDFTYTVDG